MEFRVLGPVEVLDGEHALPVGSGRERFVLASLLLEADRLVPADRLIDTLWTTPPRSAKAQLHNMISNLRRRLGCAGDRLILTRPLGYQVDLDGHRLDLAEFRRLVRSGRRATGDGDHGAAASVLAEALALWRGPAMADLPDELAGPMRAPLHEERLAAAEARMDVDLAGGRYPDVLLDLPALLAEHPYRERLYELRMLALVGAGRRVEALQTYRQVRSRFADDLGVEPGPALRDLERRILCGQDVGPAPAPGPQPPRQLPPVTVTLTGRDKLLDDIAGELRHAGDSTRPVATLVGPGGIGKTTLALAAAHRAAGAFPDGQLYANLRGTREHPAEPHAVIGRFLRALGVDGDRLPDDPEERAALYRSRLAGGRLLVVLDDAAGEEQLRPLLPSVGGCAALVTSRRQLGALVGAARWTVPVLAATEAQRLLVRVIGQERAEVEPDAAATVAAITELCGHLPLAVSIAAARLAVRTDWTLAEFRDRLADERGRLDELAVGDLDVRASIALSYRTLRPASRRLFRRLGLVAAADWPGWVATALVPGRSADRLLDELADMHLVEPVGRDQAGQGRFRLHDLVAEFAAERATAEEAEPDRTAALTRVLAGWLGLATEADQRLNHGMISGAGLAGPPPPDGAAKPARRTPRDWFEAERVSLTGAVDQASRMGAADLAGRLALRLSGFLALCSYQDDREQTLLAAVRPAGGDPGDELAVRLYNALFSLRASSGQDHDLPGLATDQVAAARRLGDQRWILRALINAGTAARRLARLADAAEWFNQAVTACGPGADPDLRSKLLLEQARLYRAAGQPEHALELAGHALALRRELGNQRMLAMFLVAYAGAATEAGATDQAEPALAEAEVLNREVGDSAGSASVEFTRAELDIRRGKWQSAEERLYWSLTVFDDLGDRDALGEVFRDLGEVAMGRGEPHRAVEPLRRSLAIWLDIDAPLEIARTLARLELAHRATGAEAVAAEHRDQCLAILDELGLDEACLLLPPVRTAG